MRSLISKTTYRQFEALRNKLSLDSREKLAPIFVPVGPVGTKSASIKMLFYGQSNYWREIDAELSFDQIAQNNINEIETLSQGAGQSPFWQSIQEICDSVLRSVGRDTEEIGSILGWSNLMKITKFGIARPSGSLQKAQMELCRHAVCEEISAMRPTATIFLTGDYGKEIILEGLGPEGWFNNVKEENRVAIKRHPDFGTIFWAYHPRHSRAKKFETEIASFIAGYVAAIAAER